MTSIDRNGISPRSKRLAREGVAAHVRGHHPEMRRSLVCLCFGQIGVN